jgi:hypothetical protein
MLITNNLKRINMDKKLTNLIPLIIMFLLATSIFTVSCTKEGPPGPPGADGQDATETCMTCHNFSETIVTAFSQYANSIHASGNNVNQTGANCSRCHTSQGFRNFLADGEMAAVTNPAMINCRTCHKIHETNTEADWELRTMEAVALVVGGASYDYGNSNLCANCHQARSVTPYPVPGGDDITITNARYGPHYGPQANMLAGSGPFEVPGSMPYQNSKHTDMIPDGCITCHMSPAVGLSAGGHQMNLSYTTSAGATAYNYSGCTTCHTDAAALSSSMAQNRAEISALKYQLRDLLQEKGLLNAAELIPVPLTMTQVEAGAIMNYKFVYGDNSDGAHNYLYTKALLVNTLESPN